MSTVPEVGKPIFPRRSRGRAGVGLSGRETLLLLIPALLPIVILSVLALARGIYLGFTDSQAGLGFETSFIGLDNFRALLDDELFVNSFKIGLIWSVAVTAIGFCFALGLALLLSQDLKGRWLARSLALVPWAMPSVIVGIMWKLFFQPQAGILNEILRRLHIPGETTDWLSSFTWALPAVILVGVWAGMPQTTVALLAGLQSIQDELHEAAAVDGATAWQRFRTITLPQLKPVIIAITTLDFIWNFNSFGLVYVLTEGGPAGKTQLPMLFAYNQAFEYGEFGYASALGNAMVVVIATITGRSCGNVIVRKRCQALAPSTAAASWSSSWIDCTPASRAIVVCGMPAQTPTRITAGSAHVKSDSQSMFAPGRWARCSSSLSTPACGW